MRTPSALLSLLTLALTAACAGPRALPSQAVADWAVIGTSAEGRPVRALETGSKRADAPRVALITGIHGDEPEGLPHVAALLDALADAPARVRVLEDISPDGTARGTRHTASGVDPNRNWPARNFTPAADRGPRPLSEPEVAAAHADLVRFDPELVIVLHSSRRGPFVNYDGPAAGYAEVFAEAAGAPWHVVPDMGYATPGSFGSWMGKDRNVPTLTVELRRGAPPEECGPPLLRAIPATIAAFVAGGPAPRVL